MQKKQCRRLIQIAYYQAGKIVVQTLLPQHPPVALITLNLLGITSSTSADIHIPINNTQYCSSLETRLIGLYGGKAASLLFEYQVLYKQTKKGMQPLTQLGKSNAFAIIIGSREMNTRTTEGGNGCVGTTARTNMQPSIPLRTKYSKPEDKLVANTNAYSKGKNGGIQKGMDYKTRYSDKKIMRFDPHFAKIGFTGAGNNPFQSNIGNMENQAAHRLASIMVNNWNFYSINDVNKSIHLLERDSFFPVNETGVAPYLIRNISVAEKKYSISRLLAILLQNNTSTSYRAYTCASSIPELLPTETVGNGKQDQFSENVIDKTFYFRKNPRGKTSSFKKKNITKNLTTPHFFITTWDNQLFNDCTNPLRAVLSACCTSCVRSTASPVFPASLSTNALYVRSTVRGKGSAQVLTDALYLPRFLPTVWNKHRGILPFPTVSVGRSSGTEETQVWRRSTVRGKSSFHTVGRITGTIALLSTITKKKPSQIKSKQRSYLATWQTLKSFLSFDGTPQKKEKLIQNWSNLLPRKGSFLRSKEKSSQSKLLPILAVCTVLTPYEVQGYTKYSTSRKSNSEINFAMELHTLLPSIPTVLPWVIQAILLILKKLAQLTLITKINTKYLRFAIYQTKNPFQFDDTTDSSAALAGSKFVYNNIRTSVDDIGEKISLSTDAFRLINPLHLSNGQRDRFYPSWFRLYLPDIEATEFLKNVSNYYFSLGLQTVTNSSSKKFTRILYANISEHFLKFPVRQALPSVYLHSSLCFLWTESKSILWLAKQSVPKVKPVFSYSNVSSPRTIGSASSRYDHKSSFTKLFLDAGNKQEPGNNKRQLENSLMNFKDRKRKESGTINIRRAFQKESIHFVSQSSIFSSSIGLDSLSSLNLKTCSLSLIQKVFFCCGNNNLSIGMGLLRSGAKRRNQLNIKNLLIDYPTFGTQRTTCFTPTVLIHNEYSYVYEVQLKQIYYPTISMVLWGFLKPWKMNRFVNIDFRQILACTDIPIFGDTNGNGLPEIEDGVDFNGASCARQLRKPYTSSIPEVGNGVKHWVGNAQKGIGSNTKILLQSTKQNLVTRKKKQCLQVSQKLQRHNRDKLVVEKEFLFHALINNCFVKSLSLVNQNRQLIDYFVDYLIRFQILRQHQILYIFSTLLLTCKK